MGIIIGAKPESGFTDPLGLLSDCHRRIEKFLQNLITVTEQAQGDSLNPEQRETLEVALRYFREAAPRHMRDEEVSLFPRLRDGGSSLEPALAALDALECDHQEADTGHAEVDRIGRKWLALDRLTSEETVRLGEVLRRLQSLYKNHIHIEDTQIFPVARGVLSAETIETIGREMAARRGIDLDTLPDLKQHHRGIRIG